MAGIVSIQNSLSAGELSPNLFGRTDLEKYHAGLSTCRNFFSNYRGGVMSRAGLAYVGTCKQAGNLPPPRDIPFQFSLNQGYVLEFGEFYMRIKSDGAYIVETGIGITGISQSNPAVISLPASTLNVGDWLFISGVNGMTNFNGLTWIVASKPDSSHITVTDLFGNTVNSTTFNAYTSGGTAARLYTVVAPYHSVDLPYLKYTQSADVMTLTCVNTETGIEYPPYSLVRNGNTNWVFTQDTFSSNVSTPTGLTGVAQSSSPLSTWYSYVVTAVSGTTGEESVATSPVKIQNNDISLFAGTNTLSWMQVLGAGSYNIYASTPSYGNEVGSGGLYGFIGSSLGTSFSDTNIVPDFTRVPPQHYNPFSVLAINDVVITASGTNYSNDTISWAISTTGSGTGFSGFPVVTNGGVTDFVITNRGQNYNGSTTISFGDSGGGVAIGVYVFVPSVPPIDGNTVIFNGVTLKFVDTTNSLNKNQLYIQSTVQLAAQALADYLNSSTNESLNCAVYTVTSPDSNHATLHVTYKKPGVDGNSYTLASGTYGGAVSGTNLIGGGVGGLGALAHVVLGPSSGVYPSVAAYFQQRRVYAGSLNQPDTYWMTQPGLFNNMDSSIPITDSDSITGTPWAQQVNGIQWLVPMPGGLVVLTGRGAWQVNGGSQAAITPSNQTAVPQAYNGCNDTVPPITINYDILYVQSKGSIVRDLAYNFFTNIYTGTDLTVLSDHLFTDYQITQWAWSEEPYKLVWLVRNDGILLCLTYLKEQDVYSWTRHDTNGQFVSVCSVTEPPVDAVYVITKRFIQGVSKYYSERMDNRIWSNVEDSFCVDSGLKYPQTFPNATLTPASATGTNVIFTASSPVFNSGQVGDVLRVGGGIATVTSFISSTAVRATITQPITAITPNNPINLPIPQIAGTWSIAFPVTTVTGLNHLNGQTVAILADGSVVPNQVVVNNSITLPAPATNIVIGLPYTCQVQTLYIDHPDKDTVQNRRKIISSVGVRCVQTRGLQIGSDQPDASTQQNYATVPWTNMDEIKDRTMFVNAGSAVPLFTGDYYKNISSTWTTKGQIAVQQIYPLPATILSAIAYWTVGDTV